LNETSNEVRIFHGCVLFKSVQVEKITCSLDLRPYFSRLAAKAGAQLFSELMVAPLSTQTVASETKNLDPAQRLKFFEVFFEGLLVACHQLNTLIEAICHAVVL
jgi:hypothetical protein